MKKTLRAKYVAKHCRIVLPTEAQPESSIIFHMVPAVGWFNKLLAKADPSINLARLTKETLVIHSDSTTFTYPCDFHWLPENHPISNWDEVMEARVKLQQALKKLEHKPKTHEEVAGCTFDSNLWRKDVDDNTLRNLSLSKNNTIEHPGYKPDFTEWTSNQNYTRTGPVALVAAVSEDTNCAQQNESVATETKSCVDFAAQDSSASDCSCSSGE